MDNQKKAHKIKMAMRILSDVLQSVDGPPQPAFKRGDISVSTELGERHSWIHNGYGMGRWLGFPGNSWTPDDREDKMLDRFATRSEWSRHFPYDPYPLPPTSWGVVYNNRAANLRKSTTGDGWVLTMDHVARPLRCGLIMAKAIAAEKLCVPDDVELTWGIVE